MYANPNFRLSDYGSSMTFMASLDPGKFNLISKLEICVEIIQREWDRAMDRMRNGLPAAISQESFADLNDFAFLFGLEMRNPVMDMVMQNIGRLNVSPYRRSRWSLLSQIVQRMEGLQKLRVEMGIVSDCAPGCQAVFCMSCFMGSNAAHEPLRELLAMPGFHYKMNETYSGLVTAELRRC